MTKEDRNIRKEKYDKEYRLKNKEKFKKHYLENKEKIKEDYNTWRLENKEEINTKYRKYIKDRKLSDPVFRISLQIRKSILRIFKDRSFKKSLKTEEILGCSFEEFKIHLESKSLH